MRDKNSLPEELGLLARSIRRTFKRDLKIVAFGAAAGAALAVVLALLLGQPSGHYIKLGGLVGMILAWVCTSRFSRVFDFDEQGPGRKN